MKNDRNFDDLAERFESKVYGGLKGDIRQAVIWRDLCETMPSILEQKPLNILDVGGGLGHLTVRLAQAGHRVTYNDLSEVMYARARASARKAKVESQIHWQLCPYQDLATKLDQSYDLVICHALIEWLARPDRLLQHLTTHLASEGCVSLTYYNENSLIYRNLIRGNFKVLQSGFQHDSGSLTPYSPMQPAEIEAWSKECKLEIKQISGIRVFHDYVTTVRGGHENPQAVLQQELAFSQLEPFKWLGRYIHCFFTREK